jgi:hypothetical protein
MPRLVPGDGSSKDIVAPEQQDALKMVLEAEARLKKRQVPNPTLASRVAHPFVEKLIE